MRPIFVATEGTGRGDTESEEIDLTVDFVSAFVPVRSG